MSQTRAINIAVFGAGATGCYLAAQLAQAQFDVTVICRNYTEQQIEQNHGITMSHFDGTEQTIMPTTVTSDINRIEDHFDYVFITLKCHHIESVLNDLLKISHHNTTMVFMQNGLNSRDGLLATLYPRPCLFGITAFNVVHAGSGHFHQATEGRFIFPNHPSLRPLAAQFNQQHINCELTDDIQGIINGKLLLNLNNALNAISDLPLKNELSQRQYRQLLAAAMREWLAICDQAKWPVAKLTKVAPKWLPVILSLPDFLFTRLAKQMLAIDPTARSSMWQDIQDNRKTEIDFINGAVVALGQEYDVPTPVNLAISQTLYRLEQGEKANLETLLNYLGQSAQT